MEKIKRGRPKSKTPTRDKAITFRLTEKELERAQKVCIERDINYVDIFLKGVESWSNEQ